MYKTAIFFLAYLGATLGGNEDHSNSQHLEGEPHANISNCVNSVTGKFHIAQIDLQIAGREPILIPRLYSEAKYESSTTIFPHTKLKETLNTKKGKFRIEVCEPTGALLHYRSKNYNRTHCRLSSKLNDFSGFTNTSKGRLNGQTNIRNRYLSYDSISKTYTLHCGDGRKLYYTRSKAYGKKTVHPNKIYQYVLNYETLPNGNRRCFQYDGWDRITKIFTTDPTGKYTYATATFSYNSERKSPNRIDGSDGQYIEYQYDNTTNNLTSIQWSNGKIEKIGISGLIKNLSLDGKGEVEVFRYQNNTEKVGHHTVKLKNYYDSRRKCVKSLQAPTGKSGTKINTHLFFYHLENGGGKSFNEHGKGFTDVYDAENNSVRYRYDDAGRHTGTEYYSNSTGLIFQENFFWKGDGDLIKKVYKDSNRNHYLTLSFEYDKNHNCIKEILTGDLQGCGNLDNYPICYEYSKDGFNLVTKVTEGKNSTTTSYLENTNLPIEKFHYYKDRIYKREFFHYDKHHRLLKEIIDDGNSREENDMQSISMRAITSYTYSSAPHSLHLVESIEKMHWNPSTNSELSDSKTKYYYNSQCKVIRKEQFDNNNRLNKTTTFEYDERGNLIKETNPINEVTVREYDKWNYPIKAVAPNNLVTKIHYDQCFREICREEHTPKDPTRVHSTSYDLKSQVKKVRGPGGQITKTNYDSMGNLLSESKFANSKWIESKNTYNPAGKPITHIDGNGNKTSTTYTCRGKPVKVIYPDGATVIITYNLDGTIAKTTDRVGKYILYEYDHLKRPTKKSFFALDNTLLEEEMYTYSTFQTLSQTKKGVKTSYEYNYVGQKTAEIVETKEGCITTTFAYDPMGRVEEKIIRVDEAPPQTTRFTYDKLDRITSETQIDENEKIQSQIQYTYDSGGNKNSISILTTRGRSTEYFTYDPFNRLVEKVDRENRKTNIAYIEEDTLKIRTTEPSGRITLESYDTLGQVTKREVFFEDNLIQSESYSYDNNGNKIEQKSLIDEREKTVTWTYDSNNQPTSVTQSSTDTASRTSLFSYTTDLQLKTVTKPNGNSLHYRYNKKGLEEEVKDDFGTVYYTILYDKLDRPIEIYDHLQDKKSTRKYSTLGYLLKDRLGNGHTIRNRYLSNGQRTTCQLPDNSSIHYQSGAYYLKSITRHNAEGKLLYKHKYLKHEKGGAPLTEQAICDLGLILHKYKLSGKEVERTTPFTSESHTKFDPNGNLLAKALTIQGTPFQDNFTYDPLDQITNETGTYKHSYSYDSHYNRDTKDEKNYTVDGLNQVLTSDITEITYDACGRPTYDSQKQVYFSYDGLDRLIRVETPSTTIEYTYDYWNRRITKKTPHQIHDFLYDGENEIGRITDGKIDQLRILGLGQGAEIGAAVAIELDAKVYLPIHSISGNIIALIDPTTKTTVSQTTYSAFGEQTVQGTPLSPWRFQSKRYDIDLDLTFFGRRYYDASLGRFITPDPKGLPEIPNLYPFVLNNPFSAFDLYGLEPLFDNEFSWSQPEDLANSLVQYSKQMSNEGIRFEAFEHKLADKKPENVSSRFFSSYRELGRPELPNNKFIILITGIFTDYKTLISHMEYLSDVSGGYNVHAIHNPTHGGLNDLKECIKLLRDTATEPVIALADLIQAALNTSENASVTLIAFSQGGAIAHLEQRILPHDLRKKVSVVGLAPARSTPREICKTVHEYATTDFIPYLQLILGKRIPGHTKPKMTRLNARQFNQKFEHAFQSSDFKKPLENHIGIP